MVLTLAEVTQPRRGELRYLALEQLSAFLHSRELGPVSFPFLKDRVLVRDEERRSQLHLIFSPSSAKHLSAFGAPRTSGNISKAREEGPKPAPCGAGRAGSLG